uniref:Uncharacterized protein n=1 Tax=Anabas testudineus TaxID=64144 RepID=A0A3Q1JH64_ANATE
MLCRPGMPASAIVLGKSTGSVSVLNQVPNWKVAPPPSTCATINWFSPEACLPPSLATGSCRRYVDMALCQMASCSREGLAVDTGLVFSSCPAQKESKSVSCLTALSGASLRAGPCMGLRPSLPDPNADPALAEERISQEASELEKRLSMLSQCSLASSTASTYSCCTSVAGDDRSSISSSSSSQSEASYGTRLPFWMDPLARSHLSNETASSSSTLKALTGSDDQLCAAGGPGTLRSSAHICPRGLHDSGRQSSLDSGIGIATGSQSSYSGSVSSYTGSLDTTSQGGGEEFGSVASLPAPSISSPPSVPPPSSPPPPPPLPLNPEPSSATSSSCTCTSRCSSCASRRHSDDYQIPNLLRLRYDTPKSLLQTQSPRDPSAQGGPLSYQLEKNSRCSGEGGHSQGQGLSNSPTGLRAQHQAVMQRSLSWDSERVPSVDGERRSTPRPLLAHGETQWSHDLVNYISPEKWQSAKNKCLTQVASSPSGLSPSADKQEAPLCVREEPEDSGVVGNKLAALKRLLPSRPPSAPPPLPVTLSTFRPTSAYGVSQPPREAPLSLDTRLHCGSSVNYVNVPISPLPATTNRELLYTELNLKEPSSVPVFSVHSAVRGNTLQLCRPKEGSIRYAHLDMAAMETAQRVGAEHVQGREDRLTQLESRRREPPH